MLSIDEAISHAREVAEGQKRRSGICVQNDSECDKFSACLKCAEEHEQLAEWLEELKMYRESSYGELYSMVYNKAIDECNKKLDELERNYKSCYGTEIIEMYADVYEDFRAWLKEQNK